MRPVVWLAVGLLTPTFAQELARPQVEREGALVRITVEVAGPSAEGLTLGLGRGERIVLAGQLTPRAGGGLLGTVSTTRLLVPGKYELLLVRERAVVARCELALGKEDERQASQAREQRWLAEQGRVARTLAVSLERWGCFQRGLAQLPGLDPAQAKARMGAFLTRWRAQLRQSRGELALFERRLVEPHVPAAVEALRSVHALLSGRADAWEAALGKNQDSPSEAALLEAAGALEAAGVAVPAKESWVAGPLGQVPAWDTVRPGEAWTSDGFSLSIPAGFGVTIPPPVPEGIRLRLASRERKGVSIMVTVSEDPELRDVAALETLHATFNWESHPGYTRPVVERPAEGGLLVRFGWDVAGTRAAADAPRLDFKAVQRVLFAPARGRTVVLEVAWPGQEPEPPELAALLASFRLLEEPR